MRKRMCRVIVLAGVVAVGAADARWCVAAGTVETSRGIYEAPRDVRQTSAARLVVKPSAVPADGGWRIRFEVSRAVDVEVAVLDVKGSVVRHLAAGLLGPHAPEPLEKDRLKQDLRWDGKDDAGRAVPADGGPFRVRVRIGATARLEKALGGRPDATERIVAMTVGAKGELYVLQHLPGPASFRQMRVLDRNGRYLRTIMPYSAKTPAERTESVGHLTVDGRRVPVVYNGHAMSLYPLIPNMPRQTMAWNPKGYVVAASATDSAFEFGLPRHLLAFHPEGGAPAGVPFVGPELSIPIGLLRGLGRSLYQRFDNLACSPDGTYVYYTGADTRIGSDYYSQLPRCAVFRFRWDVDPRAGVEEPFYGVDGRPGHEDQYLNDPRGLAVDAAGNLYICDRNNNRVLVVSPEGRFLGKFAVQDPEQVAVHPKTGEIYVLCRQAPTPILRKDQAPMFMPEYTAWRARAKERWERIKDLPRRPTHLVKFSAWKADAPPRQLDALEREFDLMALDAHGEPARLWITVGGRLSRLVDKGSALEADVLATDPGSTFIRPGHLVADPQRKRVLVMDRGGVKAVDLETGRVADFAAGLRDMAWAPDGTLVVIRGRSLQRLDADGKRMPLVPDGPDTADIGAFGPMGDPGRSLTVAPNGDIYLMRIANEKGIQNRVDVFAPDGRKKKAALIDGLGIGDAGLSVDARGNVYAGVNVKPSHARLPAAFRGLVPEANWLCWVQWTFQFRRGTPWYYTMRNEYLYHYGAVMKFGPEGGAMYGRSPGATEPFLENPGERKRAPVALVENAPAGAVEYRSGYLYHRLRIQGAEWRFAGTGIVPTSERYWGDPSCVCLHSRLDGDAYGRVFAPDCFQFRVHMLDANGNLLSEVGRYGNVDDAGSGIHFAWPAHVHAGADGKLYVSDSLNARIVIVGFDYADQGEAVVAVK